LLPAPNFAFCRTKSKEAYDEAALTETICRDWFRHFKSDFDVEDKKRAGRPTLVEDAELETLLDEDPCQKQEELAVQESSEVAPANHFYAFKGIGNDSKAKKLGTV